MGEKLSKLLDYTRITGNPAPVIYLDELDKTVLNDRKVIVTGAGGSIGSRICHLLSTQSTADVIMLDRDENALHSLSLLIQDKALMDQPDYIVADIRDQFKINSVITKLKPDYVIHAAALKHVPTLERDPREALLTNVIGTYNVVEASRLAKVSRFVNISTDKAANPISILGKSKKYGELLISSLRDTGFSGFTNVRFGNVFNSKGSVLETFNAQIERNLPITITDKNMRRFFMHIDEAAQLVIKSMVLNEGPIHVLRMGEQILITDIVQNLFRFHQKSLPINYVGARIGEKLEEELIGINEFAEDSSDNRLQVIRSNAVSELPAIPLDANSETEIRNFFLTLN